jgi:hypothetical protein
MNFLKYYLRFNDENTLLFDKKLDSFTGKSYPMGMEQFLLQRAKKEGILEGETIGIEKGADIQLRETIKNARLENMSIESIARIVKLLPERVREILDEMGIE